ncbi:hypothetical protein HLRTI_003236 [Halorhabdus tiamatea SARL4B]|uniref:Uncharacterized protein n=1 Tax=Halorhabdus tiamatea SARL4B TaxID=1033806 RepID=F7PLE7_9EURY|nr:hypothetical protein [Halorhabdus tiamatea]ERJ04800.1 hypothetical protein HLRTI_003236 [Halorhabdus tiamatea SARL4B]CCQ33071.1 conserved hypothetical protein [Halorhabdus tiamatea SARL4B]
MNSLLEKLRRPEYTGDNRCWPCTITNTALLAGVTGLLWLRGKRRTATALAVGGLAAIGLRGYLVPYTPSFAPELTAKLPVDPFDHGESPTATGSLADVGESASPDRDDAGEQPPDGEEVLAQLGEAGVVEFDGEDVRLDEDFRADWRREIEALRERDLEGLAAVADGATPPAVDVSATREAVEPGIVLDSKAGSPTHMRRAYAIPELAATRALAGRVDDDVARAAGRPLRSLLQTCPLCDEELIVTDAKCCGETVPTGGSPAEKLMCPSCNARFFTFE